MQTKRIPTVVGVFLTLFLIAGLTLATQGFGTFKGLLTRASGDPAPTSAAQTANVGATSFTVYWFTQEAAGGAVSYGLTPEITSGIAVDSRDQSSEQKDYTAHFVKVSGLTPNTKYYFKVGKSGTSHGDPANSGNPYEITTGPTLPAEGTLSNLSGSAKDSTGEALSDAVATWQAPGASPLAALLKADGSYDLPLSEARTTTLDAYFSPTLTTADKITVTTSTGDGTLNCQIGSVTSLPTVNIGQELDCKDAGKSAVVDDTEDETSQAEAATDSGGGFGALVNQSQSGQTSTSSSTANLNIQSGESVSTGLPTFSGKVGSKQVVKIVIHSEDVYSGTVIAGSDGSWSWTPPANLTPGEHEVTITIVNANGTTQTVTRTFFVTPGQSILPITNGTPSAQTTLTPTPVPTASELLETGVEAPTILALTTGLLFIILSVGAFLIT